MDGTFTWSFPIDESSALRFGAHIIITLQIEKKKNEREEERRKGSKKGKKFSKVEKVEGKKKAHRCSEYIDLSK